VRGLVNDRSRGLTVSTVSIAVATETHDMFNQTQMSPAVRIFGGATFTTFTLFLTGGATFLLFQRLPDTCPALALVVLLYVKGLLDRKSVV
jgi:hypothetical protein